jgi:hypothetical protein
VLALAFGPARADKARPGAIDIAILWDGSLVNTPQEPLELGAFLGTLRGGDRVAVLTFTGSDTRVVQPLRRVTAAQSRSLAYDIVDGLGGGATTGELPTALGRALDHLAEHGDEAALSAVVLVTGPGAPPETAAGDAGDAATAGLPEQLLSRYLLEEVILHAVIRGDSGNRQAAGAARAAGGRSLVVTPGSSLADALSFAYESLQLAAIGIARQRPTEGEGPEDDYSFLDETKTIEEIEQTMKDRAAARDRSQQRLPTSPAPTSLLIVLVVLSALILALLVFLTQRLARSSRPREARRGKGDERLSPSFSKLTLDLSRFTRLYDEAGEKLRSLSLDLEDYGAASWDIEKRMLDNYVSVADSLFLLIDHLEVQSRGAGSSGETDWFLMRLRQILEDENIAEIAPEPGEEFDSKQHSRAGEREDAAATGTVLELTRKGYVRKRGPTGDDLVLRQAEVIVSSGVSGGSKPGGTTEED